MKQKSWKQLSLVPNKTAEKPVPMTSFVLGSWWNTEQSMNCSWGVSKTSWCSRRTNCGLCWLRRASSLGVSGGLLVQHWLDVAEQRGEKLRHSLIAWKRQRVYQTITVFASLCVRLCSCSTWEDVDVDDGEGVRVYVDDDVHAEQGHAQLHSELSDQGGHGLRAGRRQAGHLLIQLGEKEERGGYQPKWVPLIELFTSRVCTLYDATLLLLLGAVWDKLALDLGYKSKKMRENVKHIIRMWCVCWNSILFYSWLH